jgi:hypothetical protein
MKLHLLQELMNLNQAFENVVRGLERMEKVGLFDQEQILYSRAEVENARVDANREFFDKFEEIVEKDAQWAYKFCREYDQKTKDPFDFYVVSALMWCSVSEAATSLRNRGSEDNISKEQRMVGLSLKGVRPCLKSFFKARSPSCDNCRAFFPSNEGDSSSISSNSAIHNNRSGISRAYSSGSLSAWI